MKTKRDYIDMDKETEESSIQDKKFKSGLTTETKVKKKRDYERFDYIKIDKDTEEFSNSYILEDKIKSGLVVGGKVLANIGIGLANAGNFFVKNLPDAKEKYQQKIDDKNK